MLRIVDSFVAGVANIAKGNIAQAADFLEKALARAIPVAIGFLANQVGLRGLGAKVGEMIEAVREKVNGAIDWLIDKALSIGGAILNMGKSAVASVKNWWQAKKEFKDTDGSGHNLAFKGTEASAQLIISSEPMEIGAWVTHRTQELTTANELTPAKSAALNTISAVLIPEMHKLTYPTAQAAGAPAGGRTIDQVLNDLITQIGIVGVEGKPPVPRMLVNPGFSASMAGDTTGQYIYNNPDNHQPGQGAGNHSGDLFGAMTRVQELGLGPTWDKFHLIHEDFGGLATNSNLIPMPRTYNHTYRAFEGKVRGVYAPANDADKVPVSIHASVNYWTNSVFVRTAQIEGKKMKPSGQSWTDGDTIDTWREANIPAPKAVTTLTLQALCDQPNITEDDAREAQNSSGLSISTVKAIYSALHGTILTLATVRTAALAGRTGTNLVRAEARFDRAADRLKSQGLK
jgi:hypothetical protein